MFELKISDYDYKYLADQLGSGHISLKVDESGELYYPEYIELTDSLEHALLALCKEIGAERYLMIAWLSTRRCLDVHVRTVATHSYDSDVSVIE